MQYSNLFNNWNITSQNNLLALLLMFVFFFRDVNAFSTPPDCYINEGTSSYYVYGTSSDDDIVFGEEYFWWGYPIYQWVGLGLFAACVIQDADGTPSYRFCSNDPGDFDDIKILGYGDSDFIRVKKAGTYNCNDLGRIGEYDTSWNESLRIWGGDGDDNISGIDGGSHIEYIWGDYGVDQIWGLGNNSGADETLDGEEGTCNFTDAGSGASNETCYCDYATHSGAFNCDDAGAYCETNATNFESNCGTIPIYRSWEYYY